MARNVRPIRGFERILVATDGSSHSAAAVREAIAVASASAGSLVVLHVFEVSAEVEFWDVGSAEKLEAGMRAYLQGIVDTAKKRGVRCEAVMHWGDAPFRSIVSEAAKRNISMVVLGSHGRTGLARLMMGSTVSRVIGHAPCKVLVVPPEGKKGRRKK